MTLRVVLDRHQRKLRSLIQPGNRVAAVMGRGTGKTTFASFTVHDLAFRFPGIHIGIVYPEFKRARKVIWEPHLLGQYYGPLRNQVAGPPNKTDLSVTYRNGSRVTTWGIENSHGILGQRFGAVIQDESDEISASIEQAIVGPCFSRSGVNSIWLRMGTPRRGRLGTLYSAVRMAQTGVPRFYAVVVKSEDSQWVDQTWLDEQRLLTDPKTFKREYEVDFDAAEGLVYGDVFDERFHVREPDAGTQFHTLVVGQDHGYESPGAAYLIGIRGSGDDTVAHVLDELYMRRKTTDEWAVALRKWTDRHHPARITLYADPSEPKTIEAYRQKAGLRLPPDKVDNNVDDGIAAVATLFMKRTRSDGTEYARLYISPKCENLIRELGLYRYRKDPKDADSYLNDVEKRNDHGPDALRYAVFNALNRPRGYRRGSDLEIRQ